MTSRTTASPVDVFTDCAAARGLTVPQLTAWTAWETFADFGGVALGLPAEAAAGAVAGHDHGRGSASSDADALLYQWGTFTTSGRPQFHLVLSRQIAVDTSAQGPVYEQFDCRLRYELDRTLSTLGRVESWWVAGGDTALTGWIAQVSGRPEWPVLAPLRPLDVEIGSALV